MFTTLQTRIETALDAGQLEAHMGNDRWWRVRRNGKTQTWKTRPDDFRIPVKAGFRATGQITREAWEEGHFRYAHK